MPASVVSISEGKRRERRGSWSMLELAQPHTSSLPFGILLVDSETDELTLRMRDVAEFDELEEQDSDVLGYLADDLRSKAREQGAAQLIASFEDSLSHFIRITDRTVISFTGDASRAADRLFEEHVDSRVQPFVRHLPLYSLRAAATKFGESMDSEQEGWVRVTDNLRLTPDMFVARVVGQSMEPLIPDGSLCVFRTGVTGSRQGKRLLIEQFSETDFAGRYTVKRYTSRKKVDESGEWEHEEIRLEPLNREFEAFTLTPDKFRVLAEFVEVLPE